MAFRVPEFQPQKAQTCGIHFVGFDALAQLVKNLAWNAKFAGSCPARVTKKWFRNEISGDEMTIDQICWSV